MDYRHPKEQLYYTIAAVLGGLIWAGLIIGSFGLILLLALPVALTVWVSSKLFESYVFGNGVVVSEQQYPEVHKLIVKTAQDMRMAQPPRVVLLESGGAKNALAIKFLGRKYVILFTGLVDSLVEKGSLAELQFVIAHELAHHKMGHLNFWQSLLIRPAMLIPVVGLAYSRACEYTADAVAMATTGNPQASARALMFLAGASQRLSSPPNFNAFVAQEAKVHPFFGYYTEIYASHPRFTLRVKHLMEMYAHMRQRAKKQAAQQPAANSQQQAMANQQQQQQAEASRQVVNQQAASQQVAVLQKLAVQKASEHIDLPPPPPSLQAPEEIEVQDSSLEETRVRQGAA
jgi:Zn-dependent protease with chaperone function